MEDRPSRATEGFFGRRHGKTIRPAPAGALDGTLPLYRLDLSAEAPDDLQNLFDRPVSHVAVEIGFGGGERLLSDARANPGIGFIGVEPFVNGMARMMLSLAENPAPNIRVYDDDALRLLDWLPAATIDRVDLFYPDPWPKRRHWKRRFVSQTNLGRIARVLKPGGRFRFASDIAHYVNWTLLACRAHGGFTWAAEGPEDWRSPYADWTRTRYEAKALREGRIPCYLTFLRGA